MIQLIWLGALMPLLSAFGYRRAGLRWRSALGLAVVAVLLTAAGGVVLGLFCGYVVGIETGLCGKTPVPALVAGATSYLVIGSWAALSPKRVWWWSLALGAAFSASILVSYFFASAHHYCET